MQILNSDRIKYLLEAYANEQATAREEQELLQWISETSDSSLLENYVLDLVEDGALSEGYSAPNSAAMLERIHSLKSNHRIGTVRHIAAGRWWAIAASLVLILAAGAFFWTQNSGNSSSIASHKTVPIIIAPGHNGAILTLADGNKIVLDSMQNGMVAVQSGVKVLLNNGEVAYQSGEAQKVSFNTMTTPRGRQYNLVLADGTKVWLNAASSITYPTAFTGKDRTVTISGEAYFEVAHNANMPFHVIVNGVDVKVLGTHFNVNAYDDERALKVTLLEGSVAVRTGPSTVKIKPGQQADVPEQSKQINVHQVDVDAAVAWKNGYFSFQDAGIQAIMNRLSRWYDIDVIYKGDIPSVKFSGEMGRSLNLGQVLDILRQTRVQFEVKGRQLIIHSNNK